MSVRRRAKLDIFHVVIIPSLGDIGWGTDGDSSGVHVAADGHFDDSTADIDIDDEEAPGGAMDITSTAKRPNKVVVWCFCCVAGAG